MNDADAASGAEFRLDGEVALITGGTAGIGLATARCFARAGAVVVVCGRDPERGAAAEAELKSAGDVRFIRADVTVEDDVKALMTTIRDEVGNLSILVNNAGPTDLLHSRAVDGPIGLIDHAKWEQLMARTVTAVFLPTKHALTVMAKAQRGVILNISSMSAVQSIPGFDAYATGKGAVESLTRAVVASYRHLGIRCNTIRVGRIAVDHGGGLKAGADVAPPDSDPEAWRQPSLPPAGSADDIAFAALFLASPAAAYINGVVLPVDGGVTTISLMPWQTPRPEMQASAVD